MLLIAAALAAAPCPTRGDQGTPTDSEELLVGFVEGVSSARAQAIYEELGASKVEELPRIGVHRIRVPRGAVDFVVRELGRHAQVKFVEPNRKVGPGPPPRPLPSLPR